jgi:hypothetical protein
MQAGTPSITIPAPVGWSPQAVIAIEFPCIAELRRTIQPEIRAIELSLDEAESVGGNTSCLREMIRELRWRIEYTADADAIAAIFGRLLALTAQPNSLPAPTLEKDNVSGLGTEVWFLKLDALADHILAADYDDRDQLPRLFDRVNDPDRLEQYLESLLTSRLTTDGIDRRKELNFATAALVRLILWRRPRNYPWDPRLDNVVRRFVTKWQDPASGFFGVIYITGACRFRTVDLSLTFHMARYLEGKIGHWPQLIDTLFSIRDYRYPHGWLDEEGMTPHNNYDVAVLLKLGWPNMRVDQRRRGMQEIVRLLDWCLTMAIASDGAIRVRAAGETLSESYYFTIAFLDTVGYFNSRNCFWTDRSFPDAAVVRTKLEPHLRRLREGDPMARMALERLSITDATRAAQPD